MSRAVRPSDVTSHVGAFDKFAEFASRFASRAWFFCACVILVLLWAPSILVLRDIDTWQLVINTLTTIVTFLLVALLQNTQTRSDLALQHKLNAIADGLGDLMQYVARDEHLRQDIVELRDAVGLETRESSTDNDVDSIDSGDGRPELRPETVAARAGDAASSVAASRQF